MDIAKVLQANEAIENFKSAILSSVVITIRDSDTRELLWSCATDETYGWLHAIGEKIEIEQDIDLQSVLSQLQIAIKECENEEA